MLILFHFYSATTVLSVEVNNSVVINGISQQLEVRPSVSPVGTSRAGGSYDGLFKRGMFIDQILDVTYRRKMLGLFHIQTKNITN